MMQLLACAIETAGKLLFVSEQAVPDKQRASDGKFDEQYCQSGFFCVLQW